MAYDKDDLNPVKGTIGELLFANYLKYTSNVDCIDLGKPGQDQGIDWRIESDPFNHDIDVKFNDNLGDFFAVTYRNSTNIRMPFNKGCEAGWLAIVTFDWQSYLASTEQEELMLARETRDKLLIERETKDFILTKELIAKYVLSIVSVKVQRIINLCDGFEKKRSGESNTDEQGNIVATRQGTDIYAAAHIKWSALPSSSKKMHYENKSLQQHASAKPYYLTYKWPFNQNKVIAIAENGKTLEEMSKDSLNWILEENRHPKSTFYKKFQVSKDEFSNILMKLISKKKGSGRKAQNVQRE